MILHIGRNRYDVESLTQAAIVYEGIRDASGLGASDLPFGKVTRESDGKSIARISYNGRLWTPDGKTLLAEAPRA